VGYALRNALFAQVQRLSFSFHDQAQTGELMARATADVESIRGFMGRGLLQVASMFVLMAGVTLALLRMDWLLALLSLAILPALVWRGNSFRQTIGPMHMTVQNELAHEATLVQESVSGVRAVKAFGRESFEIQRFDEQNDRLFDAYVVAARTTALNAPFLDMLSNGSTVLMLAVGGVLVVEGRLTFGQLVAFYTYLLQLVGPIRRGGWLMSMATRAAASSTRIFEILDTPVTVEDAPDAVDLPPIDGLVELHDVSCAYYPDRPVLEHVSFRAEPGQTIALVGGTGSGKTSIANLIPRFYDVSAGKVTIDGFDVRKVRLRSLRGQIGVVQQETLVFSGTIRDNIAYGRPDASDEEVRAAARLARADEFIERLPENYATLIGERGMELSGGQRQRVAIARAMLTDPRVLILDEFTSNVDTETERLIRQALTELMHDRTTFVIAHRLATVRAADQVLVMERGRLVGRGKHDDLLTTCPEYAQIYAAQLREEEDAQALHDTAVPDARPVQEVAR
jgi:ATP-binding cassette subfamily B protein